MKGGKEMRKMNLIQQISNKETPVSFSSALEY
jgi:hypothetical protein